ncbi:MAG: RagB/SusD family nutrient uptake outer membrane protein [Flavobacteriaceae bacterium]
MMKKFFKNTIVLVALAVSCLTGCSDLEEKPEGILSPESFFASEGDFEAATVGVYRNLYGGWGSFDFLDSFIISAGAEDVTSRPPAPTLKQYDEFKVDPAANSHTIMWRAFYRAINNANAIISNIENLDGVSPQSNADAIEGQARFLRALSYFYLVRWFGEVPIITSENQGDAATVGQSPVADIYNLIIADLTAAENLLPPTFPEVGRATNGAAKAILAKVYLTMTGWPVEDASMYALARDKANEVIQSGVYSLERDFAKLWTVADKLTNSEFIFAFYGAIASGDGSKHHHATRPGSEGGWSDWFSEARFFNAFPEGYRKEVSFHTVFLDGTAWEDGEFGQPYIAKYRDAGSPCGADEGGCGDVNGDLFTPIIRYADVLLMYAEASNMAASGPTPEALEAVNMVRRRANNLDPNTPDASVDLASGMTQSAFDDAVIAERAWELAFENNRWFDLVRKKMVVEVNKALYPNVSENNRLLPKPAIEVDLIDGLDQNPGYE